MRPNQVFALGGLPLALLEGEPARRALDNVERLLWTPMGPRSLAPGEPGYEPRYAGGVLERDRAYHQGTVWPWLLGFYAEAVLRAHGGRRFVRWIGAGLGIAGLTGAGAFLFGKPFLTSGHGHPHVGWLGELPLASAALFDLGVYFTALSSRLARA